MNAGAGVAKKPVPVALMSLSSRLLTLFSREAYKHLQASDPENGVQYKYKYKCINEAQSDFHVNFRPKKWCMCNTTTNQ